MSHHGASIEQAWGPGFIGLVISLSLYGISLGQAFVYYRSFPRDSYFLKSVVAVVCVLDFMHEYASTVVYWKCLVKNKLDPVSASDLPWQTVLAVAASFCVTFIVQSFYAHRVWIISNKNVYLTSTVMVLALVEVVLGLSYAVSAAVVSSSALYSSPLAPVACLVSVCCDMLITGSVIYYLRKGRSGFQRTHMIIQHIIFVFVQVGVLTCIVSLLTFILYTLPVQYASYLIAAPTTTLSKCYVNSLLAVLNARRTTREDERVTIANTFELRQI